MHFGSLSLIATVEESEPGQNNRQIRKEAVHLNELREAVKKKREENERRLQRATVGKGKVTKEDDPGVTRGTEDRI